MHIANREENQQLAATAVAAATAATVFFHFRTYYKLNIVSSYIWMDSRLKGLSIESKNTQNGVRTKKLWWSEVGGLTLCRGYAIAWNPRYSVPEDAPSHTTAWLPHPGVPEDAPIHATTWLPRPGVPESSWAAPVQASFRPKTIPEHPLSTGDNILPIEATNKALKPFYNQSQITPKVGISQLPYPYIFYNPSSKGKISYF